MVIIDTDFFSSFAKIGRLNLVVKVFGFLRIPSTVYAELKQADFFESFLKAFAFSQSELAEDRFAFVEPADENLVKELKEQASNMLGDGELGCFVLAKKHNEIVLIDDSAAREYAKSHGIQTLSVPSFLLVCKKRGILSRQGMHEIIESLKEKDYYEFESQVKEELLK